jgi:hypothetical protein
MVLRIFVAGCTCLFCLLSAAAGNTATVRQYLSFEFADDSATLPGWHVSPAAAVSRDTEVAHSGSASAKVTGSAATSYDTTAVHYTINRNLVGETLRTQRVAIVPDVRVYPTVEGIREGRDEVLEVAIAQLLQGAASDEEIRVMASRHRPSSLATD